MAMYSYSLQYLRQLDTSTHHRSKKTSCTRFRKDLDFWFCYGVPLYSLYGLDICRNYNCFCLTHVWLAFEKDYDKMKHVYYNLYQNTNTVIPTETNFYKHIQEHFLFLFQVDDFSAMEGVELVSQRQVLLEEESSPCLPLRRAEWGFLLNLTSPSRQTLLARREYHCPA